ncbi:MAG: TAXI family TRAP transporter solute-binding subunit [Rhodospirillaceae bacterium]|jgi:uncharacterized protein|nr:TAXI family TRAP transporter solute-binding subunit [Rhodospirillaceae bacterium]MBT5456446.1 TAXI family TRAP transporter solute-binding subunit [Rhodospirillaceae bacterium]
MAIRIGTNIVGSTFWEQGHALKKMIEEKSDIGPAEVFATDVASPDGARELEAGDLDIALHASNWMVRALDGSPPFGVKVDIRMVAPVNVGAPFFMVKAESPLKTFDDLRGRRVALGPEGRGQHNHVINITNSLGMGMAGFEPVFAEFDEASEACLSGDVDAIWQIPVPNKIVTDLTAKHPMRILDYGPGQLEILLADHPLYRRTIIPAGAFPGQERDSAQIGVLNVCFTHARVSEDLIYQFVSTLVRETEMLGTLHHVYGKLGALIGEIKTEGIGVFEPGGVAMHPGALRAYKDAGYLD